MTDPHPTHGPDTGPGAHTREALLDAAQELFAERGIASSSLRAITAAAGANLAAVSYHFGSKEGLVRALFQRGLRPLNDERLRRLDACEAAADPPAVPAVVAAFVAPVVEKMQSREERGFARLVGRVFWEPDDGTRRLLLAEFRHVLERFAAALARALPGLPPSELHWRFHFMVGAMVHSVGQADLIERASGGLCDPGDLTAGLTAFLTAGWQAPPATEEKRDS
ncbi:MAG TPA: TetR/AcrR family transcriptional regulator [Thermoanaerobaculia bacterium]|nr:TetR/AcrR family transcriptional regulator [Thermoanaerobaculia bacterium]